MDDLILNLHLFDGGDAGAGGNGTAAAAPGAQTGAENGNMAVNQELATLNEKRLKRNPLADVRYGRQPEAMQQGAAAVAGQEGAGGAPEEETFEQLISGRYKEDFGRKVQGIIADRLKNAKGAEEKLGKLAPAMEALAAKYGVAADDIDELVAHVTDDDSLYEDEAAARNLDVATLKQIKALERDKEQNDRYRAQTEAERKMQSHFQRLVEQGEKLKEKFPGFNLQEEIKNPEFVRLTSPEVGIDVSTAYQVIHRDEIMPAAMQYAVQKSQQKMANAIQANARRPVENGAGGAQGQADVRDDPRKWTRADRAEVRRRVANGEKIVL